MIDDADYDIMSIVEDEVFNQGENTELSLVTAVLKTATQSDAAGFDGIKDPRGMIGVVLNCLRA